MKHFYYLLTAVVLFLVSVTPTLLGVFSLEDHVVWACTMSCVNVMLASYSMFNEIIKDYE